MRKNFYSTLFTIVRRTFNELH